MLENLVLEGLLTGSPGGLLFRTHNNINYLDKNRLLRIQKT